MVIEKSRFCGKRFGLHIIKPSPDYS